MSSKIKFSKIVKLSPDFKGWFKKLMQFVGEQRKNYGLELPTILSSLPNKINRVNMIDSELRIKTFNLTPIRITIVVFIFLITLNWRRYKMVLIYGVSIILKFETSDSFKIL